MLNPSLVSTEQYHTAIVQLDNSPYSCPNLVLDLNFGQCHGSLVVLGAHSFTKQQCTVPSSYMYLVLHCTYTVHAPQVDSSGKRKVLATTSINMVRYASSMPYDHDLHLRLKPTSRKIKTVMLEVSLTSKFLKEGKAT